MKKKLTALIVISTMILCLLPLHSFAGAPGGVTIYYFDAATLERIEGLFDEFTYNDVADWPFEVEQPDGTILPISCYYPALLSSQFHMSTEISQIGTHKLVSYPMPSGYEVVKICELKPTKEWTGGLGEITSANIGAVDFTITEGFFDDLIFSADYEVDTSEREKNIAVLVQKRDADSAAESPSEWATEIVNNAIAEGIVPANLQSKYTQATTRAEFCALAVALYETATGEVIAERAEFKDTEDINVQKMGALGVVTGVGAGNFAPDQKLTREQAATMLSRLANAMGKPLSAGEASFKDNGDVSSWASDAVGQMQATGIMGGVGNNTFAPKNDYTREQSIITMQRMFDIVK